MKSQVRSLIVILLAILLVLGLNTGKGELEEIEKEIILSGYSDNVISGAKINFYTGNVFEYCSFGLFSDVCYEGDYFQVDSLFELNYKNATPKIKSNKLIVRNGYLIFLSEEGEEIYQFKLQIN